MLQKLRVGGFRSLLDFEIDFRPGLNVLVGSNGAGKSNFVAALDFISKFLTSGLHDGLASIGGAAFAFSVESLATVEPEFTFQASGSVTKDRLLSKSSRIGLEPKHLDYAPDILSYAYDCRITYVKKSAVVHVSQETLTLESVGKPSLRIDRRSVFADGKYENRVEVTPRDHELCKHLFRSFERPEKKQEIEETVCGYVRPDAALLRLLAAPFGLVGEVHFDLTNLGSINIDPQAAKKATPIPHPEELQPTGQGLAAALYALERAQYVPFRSNYYFYMRSAHDERQKTHFKSILNWAQEVHSGITALTTRLEPEEVVIKPFARIQISDNHSHLYPFSKLSDGTIKWIALTTVLIAEPHYSVIEEPENFLHPRMQELFVKIGREFAGGESERQALIVTTHSETLLDSCFPEELIVLYRSSRGTKAARIKNAAELRERLGKSVFGLGYVYRTGGIDEADLGAS